MQIRKAQKKDLNSAVDAVSRSIRETYIKCYNEDIVNFFLKIHSRENIERDIESELMYVIEQDESIVGTGCAKNDEITRVYILPEYQSMGLGTAIMDFLENEIKKNYKSVSLSPSLLAVDFYKKRGYEFTSHTEHKFGSMILSHDTMTKTF